ncbi:unnamed protein product, partial [marine sediment metagenome]
SEATQIMISEVRNPLSKRYQLTKREKEILSLMVEGLSNKEIAIVINALSVFAFGKFHSKKWEEAKIKEILDKEKE